MKKYVFVFQGIGRIGGGQIYIKNKAQYMEKKGCLVYVLYFRPNKGSRIKYLEKFKEGYFPDLELNFLCLSQRQRNNILNRILRHIDFNDGDEVIIESNALPTSLWGEEIAKRTNGRNIIFSLDEKNRVRDWMVEYLEFKYIRKELAAINPEFFSDLYKKSKIIPNNSIERLVAFLGDPVEDYEETVINNLELKEKNICILGRMAKPYVIYSCTQLAQYVAKHPAVTFTITIIGSTETKVSKQIHELFQSYTNVNVNILEALNPIPKKIFSLFDLFIGGAGCANLPYRQGALTLCIDVNKNKPSGLMGYDVFSAFMKNPDAEKFEYYLDEALFTKAYKNRKFHMQRFTTDEECFSSHDEFIKNSEVKKEYFSFENTSPSKKEYIITISYKILGAKNVKKIYKFFTQSKRFIRKILK